MTTVTNLIGYYVDRLYPISIQIKWPLADKFGQRHRKH